MKKLVVIGAGMASGRVLEHLFEADPAAYDVTLFNTEPRGNYNRIMLSPVLSGEKSFEEIVTHDDDWYAQNNVTCRFGEAVTGIEDADPEPEADLDVPEPDPEPDAEPDGNTNVNLGGAQDFGFFRRQLER